MANESNVTPLHGGIVTPLQSGHVSPAHVALSRTDRYQESTPVHAPARGQVKPRELNAVVLV